MGVHTTLVPSYFDPAETTLGTAFMVLNGLHDALVKPMPGKAVAPSLAESWKASPDGLTYEFVLRKGVRFHNGEPVTAEDAKFSFERYRGIYARHFKDLITAVEAPDPGRVRFRLKQPWPDFMVYFGTFATSAGWVVPKKYLEQVGEDGFKKAPVGAGPYRFVSFNPGVELVLEAFEGYWEEPPTVKRLVFRVIPDPATRVAALKRGEVDLAFSMIGELAEEVQRTPGLSLKPVLSLHPLADLPRPVGCEVALVRQAGAPGREPGHRPPGHQPGQRRSVCRKITGTIVASSLEFAWPAPAPSFDPTRAKQLLAEAGYPGGFDAGDYSCDMTSADAAEAMIGFLQAVGIRARLRPIERAAFNKSIADKKLRPLVQVIAGVVGNAALPSRPMPYRRHLRLWRLSRHRRPVSRAGGGAGPHQARGHPAAHAATRLRAGDVRADLRAGLHQRRGAARGGVRARAHRGLRVLGALRGRQSEGQVVSRDDRYTDLLQKLDEYHRWGVPHI